MWHCYILWLTHSLIALFECASVPAFKCNKHSRLVYQPTQPWLCPTQLPAKLHQNRQDIWAASARSTEIPRHDVNHLDSNPAAWDSMLAKFNNNPCRGQQLMIHFTKRAGFHFQLTPSFCNSCRSLWIFYDMSTFDAQLRRRRSFPHWASDDNPRVFGYFGMFKRCFFLSWRPCHFLSVTRKLGIQVHLVACRLRPLTHKHGSKKGRAHQALGFLGRSSLGAPGTDTHWPRPIVDFNHRKVGDFLHFSLQSDTKKLEVNLESLKGKLSFWQIGSFFWGDPSFVYSFSISF